MDIRTLLSRVDIIENNNSSLKQYLSEGLYSIPEMQSHWKRIDEGFVQGYEKYLAEVALTPDQIQNIFKQASGGAAGGEAVKDPGKLAAIVDKVLPSDQAANLEKTLPAPDAGPVQGFEEKAGAAVQGLKGVDNSTKQSLMQMVKAGVSKPETQQLILAAVGAGLGGLISKVGPILSMIPGGGPVAAAITGAIVAGGVAVIAAKLQGKDWKTAFKGAIKPALMGGASAVVGNLVTSAVSTMMSGGSASTDDTKASSGQGKANDDGEAERRARFEKNRAAVQGRIDAANDKLGVDSSTPGDYDASGTVSQMPANGNDGTTQKRGDSGWDKMSKVPTNPDGSPMTNDQVLQAKANLRYGNTHDMSNLAGGTTTNPADAGKTGADFAGTRDANGTAPYATGSSDWSADKAAGNIPDLPVDGVNPNADVYAKQAQDQIALNQNIQARADTRGIGQNFDAGAAPTGPDGTPMQAVPMDAPATQPGINRLTGKPFTSAPTWDQMTPDQQAATTARQQQQAADAAQGADNAKQYWANKNPNTRSLKESFSESIYVDKQATLRKWLDQEARGLAVSGLALKPIVKEGIMDSLKGMFGGKKGAAPAAGGVTADALNKAWTAAGSPTDSEEVAKVLQSAGVPAETVGKVFTDLKLPAPGAAPATPPGAAPATPPGAAPATPPGAAPATDTKAGATATPDSAAAGQVNKNGDAAYSQAKKLVMSLTKQQQQQVMQYLQKQLGQA